jgi:putative ABC transport system permease protein
MIALRLAVRHLLFAHSRPLAPILLAGLCLCCIDLLAGNLEAKLRRAEHQAVNSERLGHLTILASRAAGARAFDAGTAAMARRVAEHVQGVSLVVPVTRDPGQPGDAVARLAVYLSEPKVLPPQRAVLAAALADQGVEVEVRYGRELSDQYIGMRAKAAFVLGCAAGAAIAVIGAFIAATATITRIERRRQFATLRALGMRPGSVFGQVAAEALLIALCAVVLGMIASALVAWTASRAGWPHKDQPLPAVDFAVELDPVHLVMAIVAVLATAFLAAFIPAFKAARADVPADLAGREQGGW